MGGALAVHCPDRALPTCMSRASRALCALSALTLLTQADLSRIKQCQGDHCGWLFLDTTKNKSRRWCEMEVCGNRAKQKRFARTKAK